MKILVFTAVIFCSTFLYDQLCAQPVITGPLYGSGGASFTYKGFNADGFDVGPSGADVTWDFSGITFTGLNITGNVVSPPATPYSTYFPDATTALTSDDASFEYLIDNGEEVSLLGIGMPGNVIVYDDPERLLVFPLQFNDTSSDSFHSIFTSGVEFERSGTVTMQADGYGTLILPSGTYTNLLRVLVHEIYTDVATGLPATYEYDFENYYWLANGTTGPAFEYFLQNITVGSSTTTSETGYVNDDIVASINTVNTNKINISPNPANDVVTISGFENLNAASLQLFDMAGNKVLEKNIAGQINSFSLQLPSLPNGIYQFVMQADNAVFTNKIMISN